MLAFVLAGCRGSIEIPPQPPQPAPEVVEAPPRILCSVRAAQFHGLVTVPCESIAERIRP